MAAEAVYIRATGQTDDRPVDGQKDVTTAGTAVCLVSESTPCAGVIIQAKRTNTGRIYIGGVNVLITTLAEFISQPEMFCQYKNHRILISITSIQRLTVKV